MASVINSMSDLKNLTCLQCGAPMKLLERLADGILRRNGNKFRRRRMKCSICDYQELIHANGERDVNADPRSAIEEAGNIAKPVNGDPDEFYEEAKY